MSIPLSLPPIVVAAMAMTISAVCADDGSNLVYISDKLSPPAPAGNTDVRVAEITADGSRALYVLSAAESSPDGKLYSVPIDGGEPVELLDGISSFKPSGIAFQATPNGQYVIGFQEGVFPTGDILSSPISG